MFQVQHFSSQGHLDALKELVADAPDLVHRPWTAQEWLPLSQAVCASQEDVVEFLLSQDANAEVRRGWARSGWPDHSDGRRGYQRADQVHDC
jgi:hypothetical protein